MDGILGRLDVEGVEIFIYYRHCLFLVYFIRRKSYKCEVIFQARLPLVTQLVFCNKLSIKTETQTYVSPTHM